MTAIDSAIHTDPTALEPTPARRRAGGRAFGRWLGRVAAAQAWIGVVGFAVLLAFAWGLPQAMRYAPRWYLALAGVSFGVRLVQWHAGVALLGVAAGAAVGRRRRLACVSAAVALAALAPFLWRAVPSVGAVEEGPAVRIMAVNLLGGNRDFGRAVASIRAASPDVLFLSELTPAMDAAVVAALGDRFPHRASFPRAGTHGQAVYSRFPLVEVEPPGQADATDWRVATARVSCGGAVGDVTVYSIHFASPRTWAKFAGNRRQVADLIDRLEDRGGRAVVAGDFNFPPFTANDAALRRAGLTPSRDLAGVTPAGTWPGGSGVGGALGRLLGVRIDEVYISPGLTVTVERRRRPDRQRPPPGLGRRGGDAVESRRSAPTPSPTPGPSAAPPWVAFGVRARPDPERHPGRRCAWPRRGAVHLPS